MGKTLIANPELVFRQEEDEAILFNPNTGEIKLLNETAAFIYQLLDGTHSKHEIVDFLEKRYGEIERIELENDLDEYLRFMKENQLVGEIK